MHAEILLSVTASCVSLTFVKAPKCNQQQSTVKFQQSNLGKFSVKFQAQMEIAEANWKDVCVWLSAQSFTHPKLCGGFQ